MHARERARRSKYCRDDAIRINPRASGFNSNLTHQNLTRGAALGDSA